MFLFFRDARSGAPYEEGIPYENVSERVEDINYDRNRVRVEYAVGENSPSTMTLDRAAGLDPFLVMPVNQFNRDGVPTRVDIKW